MLARSLDSARAEKIDLLLSLECPRKGGDEGRDPKKAGKE